MPDLARLADRLHALAHAVERGYVTRPETEGRLNELAAELAAERRDGGPAGEAAAKTARPDDPAEPPGATPAARSSVPDAVEQRREIDAALPSHEDADRGRSEAPHGACAALEHLAQRIAWLSWEVCESAVLRDPMLVEPARRLLMQLADMGRDAGGALDRRWREGREPDQAALVQAIRDLSYEWDIWEAAERQGSALEGAQMRDRFESWLDHALEVAGIDGRETRREAEAAAASYPGDRQARAPGAQPEPVVAPRTPQPPLSQRGSEAPHRAAVDEGEVEAVAHEAERDPTG